MKASGESRSQREITCIQSICKDAVFEGERAIFTYSHYKAEAGMHGKESIYKYEGQEQC